jgi:hypothetical protein
MDCMVRNISDIVMELEENLKHYTAKLNARLHANGSPHIMVATVWPNHDDSKIEVIMAFNSPDANDPRFNIEYSTQDFEKSPRDFFYDTLHSKIDTYNVRWFDKKTKSMMKKIETSREQIDPKCMIKKLKENWNE